MAFTIISKPAIGDAAKKAAFADAVIDDLNDLNSRLGTVSSIAVPNGSFEIESSTTGVPESWTWTQYTGGACALDTTAANVASGAKAVKISHPGGASKGGGYLTSSDYIPVCPSEVRYLEFYVKHATANVDTRVYIDYYTEAQSLISSTTAYSSTSSVASLTKTNYVDITPATAAYAKLRLVGGHTDQTTAGDVYFDAVSFEPGAARRLLTATSNTAAEVGTASMTLQLNASANPTIKVGAGSAETIWHSGNDGPGSGLSADLLDGQQLGNASGNVPYSNGTVCADLVAQYADNVRVNSGVYRQIVRVASGRKSAMGAGISTSVGLTYGGRSIFMVGAYVQSGTYSAVQSFPPSAALGGISANFVYYWIQNNPTGSASLYFYNNTGATVDVDYYVYAWEETA